MRHSIFSIQTISIIIFLVFSSLNSEAQTWYQANNPFGGRILAIHETADGSLLAGTTRGLYKSTDNGENWSSISGEFENFAILSVNSTPSGMYISQFSYTLRRSFNEGQSWETIEPQDWTSLTNIVVNDAGDIFINTNNLVWRSSDNGDSWIQLDMIIPGNRFRTLEISPDGDLYGATFNKKIVRSSDNGETWSELYTTVNDIGAFGFDGNNTVYAVSNFAGMYKSTDNGDSWTMLPALEGTNGAFDINTNSMGDVFIAPYDGGVSKSTDGGMSWVDITYDLIDPTVRTLLLNSEDVLFAGTSAIGINKYESASWIPQNQGISAIYIERIITIEGDLYACTDLGVFISEDGGLTWQQSIKGMEDPEIAALAKAPNGDLYAGGEWLYYSEDGINWNMISQGFPDNEILATDILIEMDGKVIVATDDFGIRYTENKGQSWTVANSGLEDVAMNFIRKSSNGYLFTADGYNLYRTNDLEGGWEVINTGLTDTDIVEFTVGNGVLFAITYSDGLFRSTDNGDNWTLEIDEDVNNVAVNGNVVYGSGNGVFFSDDNGVNWMNIGDDLPYPYVEEVSYVQNLGLFANVSNYGLYTLDFSVVGLNENKIVFNENSINCYPNPFTSSATMTIKLEENAVLSYTIQNIQGEVMQLTSRQSLTKGTHNLQLGNDLPAGIYLITVVADNTPLTFRLIKTN